MSLTLTTTEPRAQMENPTSKLTSYRLKMCFLTETLTVRITADGRQVYHLETLNTECTGGKQTDFTLTRRLKRFVYDALVPLARGCWTVPEKQLRSLA